MARDGRARINVIIVKMANVGASHIKHKRFLSQQTIAINAPSAQSERFEYSNISNAYIHSAMGAGDSLV